VTLVPPPFPSYTSGHVTFSAAASEVLASFFPEDAARLHYLAEEAALSRVYAGIHYRFDSEAGLQSGRQLGALAIRRDQLSGPEGVMTLTPLWMPGVLFHAFPSQSSTSASTGRLYCVTVGPEAFSVIDVLRAPRTTAFPLRSRRWEPKKGQKDEPDVRSTQPRADAVHPRWSHSSRHRDGGAGGGGLEALNPYNLTGDNTDADQTEASKRWHVTATGMSDDTTEDV
jgi:hypothetical protein